MYAFALLVHSWVRWLALGAGLALFARALARRGDTPAASADRRLGLAFVIGMDVQLLTGLALYFWLSPFTTPLLAEFGAAMKNAALRFWAVEHPVLMILSVVFAHVGVARARRREGDARRRTLLVFVGLALLALVLAVPWPFRLVDRPLFRF